MIRGKTSHQPSITGTKLVQGALMDVKMCQQIRVVKWQ